MLPLVAFGAQALLTLFLAALVLRWAGDFALRLFRRTRPTGGAALALDVLWSITDPPLRFLRRHVPPLRIRSVSFDVGFLLLAIVVATASARIGGLV